MTREDYAALTAPLDAAIAGTGRQEGLLDGVILVNGADLTPEPVAWLWRYWLALGKLHILAGAPGQGKTTIAIAVAATVTVGGCFPDGASCEAGNVLIWSGEDDPADTLLPRLIAAGADKGRVFFITGARVDGEATPFDPARDTVQLLATAASIGGVSLLIVDPVVSAVAGDSHKNGEVRRALQPLVDLASASRCAVLGISHFSKAGQGQDPTQRIVGSVAFAAVARVVWVAAKVKSEDGEGRRILARSKSNIGPDDGGFVYELDQVEALRVSAGVILTHPAKVKVTHLGDDDGFFGAVDVDLGGSSGDTSDGPKGRRDQGDCQAARLLAQYGEALPA